MALGREPRARSGAAITCSARYVLLDRTREAGGNVRSQQYQPSTVVVQQSAPAVTYSSTAYPSYYHPGATAAAATTGYMVGAATAYRLNWGAGAILWRALRVSVLLQSAAKTNYASQSQQELAKLFPVGTNAADKMLLLKTKARGSKHLLPTRRNASSPPVASNRRRERTRRNVSSPFETFPISQTEGKSVPTPAVLPVAYGRRWGPNQAQRQGAAAAKGATSSTEGARRWQGGGGRVTRVVKAWVLNPRSAGQFGGRQSGGEREGGALGCLGSRSQSFSQRGRQSMSIMQSQRRRRRRR